MRGRKKRGKFGTLLFALPVILFVIIIAYQLILVNYFQSGTMIVEAQSTGKYYRVVGLNVSVNVGTQAGTTPLTLSLTQGSYTVTFPTIQWYSTPQSRTASVVAGRTTYAVGVYDPIVKKVSIEGNQFNATTVSAKHGVTPLIWINKMSGYAVLQGGPTGTIIIQPAQNYTYVFQNAGTYTFALFGTSAPDLTVSVV